MVSAHPASRTHGPFHADTPTRELRYRSHVYVCGALGRPATAALARLLEASPTGMHAVHASDSAAVWASGRLSRWSQHDQQGHYWNAVAHDSSPTTWQDAAERRMSAGVALGPISATLHGDALGLSELYTRRLGDALYFSTRIHPLTCLDDHPIHEDEAAWASILALGAPIAGATPFTEVRRVEAATAWRYTGGRFERLVFEPSWMNIEPKADFNALEVVELVAEQIPRQRLLGRTGVTLSGGWDSRLLAVLASCASRRPVLAWTTDPDTGHDLDVRLSKPVAAGLGLRQRVVTAPPDAWARDAPIVRRRLQHQVWLHTWIMPLARALQQRREPLLDGLAGDVLLKSLLVDRDVLDASDPAQALWEVLSADRLSGNDLLAAGLAENMKAISKTSFAQSTAHLSGHPACAALSVLTTRTARAIAASPLLLFAPETDVRLPFLHPDVIAASLSVPLDRKIGGDFYREVLAVADPDIGGLPSTNDGHPRPTYGRKRQMHPQALMGMAQLIRSDDHVERMLSSSLRDALRHPECLARIAGRPHLLHVLQWATMLAEWREIYRDRLPA